MRPISTRATIAIVDGNECKAIYLHSDGYLAWAGAILYDNYNTCSAAEALIDLGALSSIGVKLEPDSKEKHFVGEANDDVTEAYCRDIGESLERYCTQVASGIESKEFVERLAKVSGGNYVYLFNKEERQWFVATVTEYQKDEKADCPEVIPFIWYPLSNWFGEE